MECVYCAVRTESSKYTLILVFKAKHVTNSAQNGRNVVNLLYYYWYSALGPVWAETRVQSGD